MKYIKASFHGTLTLLGILKHTQINCSISIRLLMFTC